MSVEVEAVNGISGRDRICTLQPFNVVELIPDDDVQEDPVIPTPAEPEVDEIEELLSTLAGVIEKFRKNRKNA